MIRALLLTAVLALSACGGKPDAIIPPDPCADVECDDGIPCTVDVCTNTGKCQNTLKAGHCYIVGECAAAGESHPESPCRFCEPQVSTELWSPEDPCCKALGSDCPYEAGFQCVLSDPPRCEHDTTHEIWVPPGVFWMGCNDAKDTACFIEETPQHKVQLNAYAVDRVEVTVGAYGACVEAGACAAPKADPATGTWGQNPEYPVTGVTAEQAATYCAWDGKGPGSQRLCTEAEWEQAARGGCIINGCGNDDDTCCSQAMPLYPWGDESWTCAHVSLGAECGQPPWSTVGKHPAGASPYGVLDMAGSALELTADWFAGDFYCDGDDATCVGPCEDCKGKASPWALWVDPTGPPGPLTNRTLRGGVAPPLKPRFRSSYRAPIAPDAADAHVGFRCCRHVQID